MKRKRYVNWMKHATLNVYEIKSLSNNYITFQARLFNNNSETNESSICANIEFEVSFMNESLLSQSINLFGRLISTPLVTIRDISEERIVDKQIQLSIHVTDSDDIAKTIETTLYVIKSIKAEVILEINILEKSQNKITLHLHTKKMQLRSSHVSLNFTSSETILVSFNVAITVLRSCIRTIKTIKKTIKFAKMSEKETFSSVKLIIISRVSQYKIAARNALLNANWRREYAFNNVSKSTNRSKKITEISE